MVKACRSVSFLLNPAIDVHDTWAVRYLQHVKECWYVWLQRRAGPVVLPGHPTREAPAQTVHAIFQQVHSRSSAE